MSKPHRAELSASLIAIKGSAAPAMPDQPVPVPVREKEPEANATPLNFRVTADFRRRFKTRAAENDLSLIELLYRSFAAWEREQGR